MKPTHSLADLNEVIASSESTIERLKIHIEGLECALAERKAQLAEEQHLLEKCRARRAEDYPPTTTSAPRWLRWFR